MLQFAPHFQAGQRLKGAMRARGWKLTDLAKVTTLSVHVCCTIQQGQGRVDNYTRCCIALGVPTGLAGGNPLGRHLRLAKWDDRGLVTILEGDCFAIMPTMAAGSIPCTVTSIPYPFQKLYDGKPGWGNEPTLDEYLAKCRVFFRELLRITTNQGTAWINIGFKRDKSGRLIDVPALVAQAAEAEGWCLIDKIIWKKRVLDSASRRLRMTYEVVLMLTKIPRGFNFDEMAARVAYAGGKKLADPNRQHAKVDRQPTITEAEKLTAPVGMTEPEKAAAHVEIDRRTAAGENNRIRVRGEKCMHRDTTGGADNRARTLREKGFTFDNWHPDGAMGGNVWDINGNSSDPVHPATYTVELPERCISIGSYRGDLVFDPCMGSGTTGVAALKLKRMFLGIECVPKYVRRAQEKILQSDGKSG